jgi:isoquinoline 1-oxidoreductase beta subunit
MRVQKLSRREALKLGLAGLLSLKVLHPINVHSASSQDIAIYLSFNSDDTVTLASPFLEGGQGIFTGLAQIVAEDLDLDPERFRVHCPPSNPVLNLLNGLRFTGQSLSVRTSYPALRKLTATARIMLINAAALQMKVPLRELSTHDGQVFHQASKRSLSYAVLAPLALTLPVPNDPPLRSPSEFKTIGRSVKRLDARAKSTGVAQYTIDLQIDQMLLAAIRHGPTPHHQIVRLKNSEAVASLPGIRAIETFPKYVAVVASRWWQAQRALAMLEIEWALVTDSVLPAPTFSSQDYQNTLVASLAQHPIPDSLAKLQTQDQIEALYQFPLLAHAQLEPPSAIARFNPDGTLEVWAPNQSPDIFRDAAARRAGIEAERVIIHTPFAGGFFGRHFYYGSPSPMDEAIELAKKLKRPVKVIWSREEEFTNDIYRPITAVKVTAGLDRQRQTVTAINAVIAGEGVSGQLFGFSGKAPDETAIEGLLSDAYELENRKVSHQLVPSPIKIGYWRSVGHSSNNYATECFLDEVASALKVDPIHFRLNLLRKNKRAMRVLQAVQEKAGGQLTRPYRGREQSVCARGVAFSFSFGSYVANIAEVSLSQGRLRVEKVWVAADVGLLINPDLVSTQLQSAIIMGLSAVLNERLSIKNGIVEQTNFDSYSILGPDDAPDIEIILLPSEEGPGGVGEIGLPAIGPAIANALAVLTGRRIRALPLMDHAPFTAMPL